MSESTHNSGKRVNAQAFEIAWLGFRARPGTCWEDLTCDRTPAKIAAARISAKATTSDETRSFFLIGLVLSDCDVVGTWLRFGDGAVVVATEPLGFDGPSLS